MYTSVLLSKIYLKYCELFYNRLTDRWTYLNCHRILISICPQIIFCGMINWWRYKFRISAQLTGFNSEIYTDSVFCSNYENLYTNRDTGVHKKLHSFIIHSESFREMGSKYCSNNLQNKKTLMMLYHETENLRLAAAETDFFREWKWHKIETYIL